MGPRSASPPPAHAFAHNNCRSDTALVGLDALATNFRALTMCGACGPIASFREGDVVRVSSEKRKIMSRVGKISEEHQERGLRVQWTSILTWIDWLFFCPLLTDENSHGSCRRVPTRAALPHTGPVCRDAGHGDWSRVALDTA